MTTPRDTPALDPRAVEAAAEAMLRRCTEPGWSREALAEAAIAAAEPIIRAAIAAEQAAWECDDEWTCCIEAHRARSGRES